MEEVDLVILGMNGDPAPDLTYRHLLSGFFKNTRIAFFKHLCGEYFTSGAFALWLGAKILKHQSIPEVVSAGLPVVTELKNILIYNHYRNLDHSLMLIRQV